MSDRGAREVNEVEAVATVAGNEETSDVIGRLTPPARQEAPAELMAAENGQSSDVIGRLTPPARQEETPPARLEDERVDAQRRELVERIGKSPSLPPGLRSRLVEIAEAGGNVADAVLAFEESLPSVLRGDVSPQPHEHPAGEVFFRGDAEAISDEQAESIARGQLARSGMLRGQRVKVAGE